jgi:hypothetical protein
MIYAESHEPALDLRDEAVLNAEGLLLALVGVDTRIEIKIRFPLRLTPDSTSSVLEVASTTFVMLSSCLSVGDSAGK